MTWAKANYQDTKQLEEILTGIHTLLSFININSFGAAGSERGSEAQKNLIDAAVAAGVRRFAPNEWAT